MMPRGACIEMYYKARSKLLCMTKRTNSGAATMYPQADPTATYPNQDPDVWLGS